MASFTPSGGGSAAASLGLVDAPTVVNTTLALADTEVSHTFPASTRRFMIKARTTGAALKLAYSVGTSGTVYISLPFGAAHCETAIGAASVTLYLQSPVAGAVVELLSWA